MQVRTTPGTAEKRRADADVAMDRYAAGDDTAFAPLYDALAPRLLGYLRRRTRNQEDAAELLQQTMLHMHRWRGDFIAGAEVAPWAFAIAHHLLIRNLRGLGPGQRMGSDALERRQSEAPPADDLVHARELTDCVQRAVAQLPPAQRVAFELVRQDELSLAEAAQILGTTVGAAKMRVHRAFETLRAALANAETILPGGAR